MSGASSPLVLLVEESHGSLGFYDSGSGACVGRVMLGLNPHEIVVSPDGTHAYVSLFGLKDYDETIGRPGSSIAVIDVASRCEIERHYTCGVGPYLAPHGLDLSADGLRLYVNTEAVAPGSGPARYALLVFDLTAGADAAPQVVSYQPPEAAGFAVPSESLEIPHGTHTLLIEPGERTVLLSAGSGGLYRVELATGAVVAHVQFGGPVRGIRPTADGSRLIVSGAGELYLLDPGTLAIVERYAIPGVGQLLYAAPTPDDRYVLAPAVWESQVVRVDRQTGKIDRLLVGLDPIHVKVTADGRHAFVTHGRSLYASVIDVASWTEVQRVATLGGPNGIALIEHPAAPPPADTLRFGTCLPLSGPNAVEGRDIRLGYQLWEETANAAGGILVDGRPHRVEILYEDTASSIDEATIAAQTEQLHRRGVELFLGGYPSKPNLDAGRVADAHACPFVTGTGAGEFIYNAGLRHVFGIMAPARSYLIGSVEVALAQSPAPGRLLILSCDEPAAVEDARATAAFAASRGITLVPAKFPGFTSDRPGVLVHPHGHADFGALFRALAGDADGLLFMHAGHLPEAIAVAEAAHAATFAPLGFAFSVGPAVPSFRARLGRRCVGFLGSTQWIPADQGCAHDRYESAAVLAATFAARYSKEISYFAASAVGCGITYEDAIRRAGARHPGAIRDALATTDLRTSFAHIQFDHRGLNVDKPMITIQLQELAGRITEVPLLPQSAPDSRVLWPFRWAS